MSDRTARGWFLLALISLGMGSLMAVVLVVAKTPFAAEWPWVGPFFSSALVYHVNLSTIFWVQSMLAVLLGGITPRNARLDYWGLTLAWAAWGLLLLSLLLPGRVVFSNYLPVKLNSAFVCAILLFEFSLGLRLYNRLGRACVLLKSPADLSSLFTLFACTAWAVGLVSFGSALFFSAVSDWRYSAETLLWGSGHLFQLMNLMLLFACLSWLTPGLKVSVFGVRLSLILVVVLAVVLLVNDPASLDYRRAFTDWMRWFSIPFALFVLLPLLYHANGVALISALFLVAGGALGMLIRVDNLMVPAHYHAMMGAINLALMGFSLRQLWGEGRDAAALLLSYVYGLGVLLLAAGFAGAGWFGVGRKLVSGSAASTGGAEIGLLLVGVGGGLALLSVLLFVGVSVTRLLSLGFAPVRAQRLLREPV